MIDHQRQLEEAIFRAHARVWRPPGQPAGPPQFEGPPPIDAPLSPPPNLDEPPGQLGGIVPQRGDATQAGDWPDFGVGGFVPGRDDGNPVPQFHPAHAGQDVPTWGLPAGAVPRPRIVGRTWYIAPTRHWHNTKNDSGNDWNGAFDPAGLTDPLGDDILGDGTIDKPFASLNRLLHTAGVQPNTMKTWQSKNDQILLRPGDTIIMRNGIYDLHLDLPAAALESRITAKGKVIGVQPKNRAITIAVEPLSKAPPSHPTGKGAPQHPAMKEVMQGERAKTIIYEESELGPYRFARIGPSHAHFGLAGYPITLRAETPGKVIIWGGDPALPPLARVPLARARGFELASGAVPVDAFNRPLSGTIPYVAPGHWRFEGITFRNMRECITELAGASGTTSYFGWHELEIKGCQFILGPNTSVSSLRVGDRVTNLPIGKSWRKNLRDPYGTAVTNANGDLVVSSQAASDKLAAAALAKRWKLDATYYAKQKGKAGKSGKTAPPAAPAIILLLIDRDGNPYLDHAELDGYSTIRSALTSTNWRITDCVFDRVAGLADDWYQHSQAAFPFAKLGYDVGKLPGDAPPEKNNNKKPNYLLGACIYGQIVPLLTATGDIISGAQLKAALPKRDWLNHWASHTHGYYAQGYGHEIEGCRFGNIGLGYCVKIAGHRQTLVKSQTPAYGYGKRSHLIRGCTFNSTAARGRYTFEGHIRFYTTPTTVDVLNRHGKKSGFSRQVTRRPHQVLVIASTFHGPPGGAVIRYEQYNLGEGLAIRRCTTSGPHWSVDVSTVLKRELVAGEWRLVTDPKPLENKLSNEISPIAEVTFAQARDTPWRLMEANPLSKPLPSNTYEIKNINKNGELVYPNTKSKDRLPLTSTVVRIFTHMAHVRRL